MDQYQQAVKAEPLLLENVECWEHWGALGRAGAPGSSVTSAEHLSTWNTKQTSWVSQRRAVQTQAGHSSRMLPWGGEALGIHPSTRGQGALPAAGACTSPVQALPSAWPGNQSILLGAFHRKHRKSFTGRGKDGAGGRGTDLDTSKLSGKPIPEQLQIQLSKYRRWKCYKYYS